MISERNYIMKQCVEPHITLFYITIGTLNLFCMENFLDSIHRKDYKGLTVISSINSLKLLINYL